MSPRKKFVAGVIALALLGGGLAAVAQTSADPVAELQAARVDLISAQGRLDGLGGDISDALARVENALAALQTTTTTAPPTTTTTRRPTTTTTAPTTTTTVPPTTTTTLGNPPQHAGDHYDFMVNNNDLGLQLWVAPYHLDLGNGFGWGYGNRDGYKCMYGTLVEGDALTSQSPVGRFTVTKIVGAADYIIINDRYMPDKGPLLRHFGTGLLDPPDGVRQGECPPPDANVNYEPFTGPGQFPVVDYVGPNGEILERRDYRTVPNDDPRLKWRLFSVTPARATVVAYWENLPIVVVYYDAPAQFSGAASSWADDVHMQAFVP